MRAERGGALLAVEGEGEGNLGGLLGRSHRHFHIIQQHGLGTYDSETCTAVLTGREGLFLGGEGADMSYHVQGHVNGGFTK